MWLCCGGELVRGDDIFDARETRQVNMAADEIWMQRRMTSDGSGDL